MTQAERLQWIERGDEVPLAMQYELAGVPHSSAYRRMNVACRIQIEDAEDLKLRELIDAEYPPLYGSRRMTVFLHQGGHAVNRKRVQRLMGLAGMAPGPNTSMAHAQHKVYPYLLRGVPVTRPNQVWSTDITYILLARGIA